MAWHIDKCLWKWKIEVKVFKNAPSVSKKVMNLRAAQKKKISLKELSKITC